MMVFQMKRMLALVLVCVSVVSLGGCVLPPRDSFTAEAAERSRASVRNIMAAQVLNPNAAVENAGQIVEGEDGERAAQTLKEYRTKVAGGEEATEGVTINLGGS